jgi:hypothetical protein
MKILQSGGNRCEIADLQPFKLPGLAIVDENGLEVESLVNAVVTSVGCHGGTRL